LPVDCYIEVSLEKLADGGAPGLDKICNFVGLNFEGSLMKIPLDQVHAGRWRQNFSEDEKATVNAELADIAEDYGYPS
jgi:hypothetical protein